METFYIYEIRDPRPGKDLQPIYVGKGRGRRAHFHWNRADDHANPLLRGVFGKIRVAGLRPIIEIVCHFDSEADAFQLEVELIAKYGRRDLGLGPLCNRTDGGEGASGSLIQAEALRKLHADPAFAKAHAKRSRERMRKLNADPVFAKAHVKRIQELHADPEYAKVHAERMRKRNADPEFAKARNERLRKLNADPEFAKANAERLRKRHADPAFAKAHAERARNLNADPAFAKAHAERARDTMRKLRADPEFNRRAKVAQAAKRATHRPNPTVI